MGPSRASGNAAACRQSSPWRKVHAEAVDVLMEYRRKLCQRGLLMGVNCATDGGAFDIDGSIPSWATRNSNHMLQHRPTRVPLH